MHEEKLAADSPNKTNDAEASPLKGVKPYKAIFPVIIGLGVVGYMFWRELTPEVWEELHWGTRTIFWLFLALLLMAARDLGYMWRLMVLAQGTLSIRQAFRVIMLWEFTSAITPSAVGGTSVAILYVAKEGLSVGKSSAIVMITSFLDECFFLIMFPLLLLLVGPERLFAIQGEKVAWGSALLWFAIIGYSLKALWVVLLSYGFFVNPRGLKWLILKIFRLPFLRRWKYGALQAGSEIVESSREIRTMTPGYWVKAFISTFLSWISRYWVVNVILLAFFTVGDHLLIFARQLVMWIMMLVMPTPGGAGFAEVIFTRYLGEFIPASPAALPGIAIGLALLWRLATYYPYLIAGAIILPKWLRTHFKRTPRAQNNAEAKP